MRVARWILRWLRAAPARIWSQIVWVWRNPNSTGVVLFFVTLTFIVLPLFGEIDGLMRNMHKSGEVAGGVEDFVFSPKNFKFLGEDKAEKIVEAWKAFDPNVDGQRSNARDLWNHYVYFDFALIVLYVFTLRRLIAWSRIQHWFPEPTQRSDQALFVISESKFLPRMVVVAACFDIVENALMLSFIEFAWLGSVSRLSLIALAFLSAVKWVLIAITILPLLARFVIWAWRKRYRIVRLFPQLAVAITFAMLLTPPQSADAIRSWDGTRWGTTGVAVIAFALLIALTGGVAAATTRAPSSTRRAAVAERLPGPPPNSAQPLPPRRPWARLVAGLLFAAGAAVFWIGPSRGIGIPFGIVALIFLLSALIEFSPGTYQGIPSEYRPHRDTPPDPLERLAQSESQVIALAISSIPIIVLGAAVVTANAGDAFYVRESSLREGLFGARGIDIVFAVVATPIVVWLARWVGRCLIEKTANPMIKDASEMKGRRELLQVVTVLSFAFLFAVLFVFSFDRVQLDGAPKLGTIAVAIVFLAIICVLFLLLRLAAEWLMAYESARPWVLPAALRLILLRRPPLVALLIAWALISPIAERGNYHDVRTLPLRGDVASMNVAHVVQRWEDRTPGDGGPALLVSAAGGGARAAYLTAAVLTCVLETNPTSDDPCGEPVGAKTAAARRSRIMAMSGISGGSLGLAEYLARWHTGEPSGTDWYRASLSADFLSPALAGLLFSDIPNTFARRNAGSDSAEILERAWERPFESIDPNPMGELGFLSIQHANHDLPLVLLNSFSLEDGCRFNVSLLRSNQPRKADECNVFLSELHGDQVQETPSMSGTTDLSDLALCRDGGFDLPLSTAALLSARFPFVSPSGRVNGCGGGTTFGVDGGYRDSSAASPLVELWGPIKDELRDPEVTPIVLQIDNGYDEPLVALDPKTPNETRVPLAGQKMAAGGIANASRIGLERIAGQCGFVRITTWAHPGSRAPLGWILSDTARDDLNEQLKFAQNVDRLNRVRRLLDGDAPNDVCPTA